MKLQKSIALLAFCAVCMLHASAQKSSVPLNEPNYNKPKRFTDVPDKLPLQITTLVNLLNLPVGAKVNAIIAKNFVLNGTIVSKSDPSDKSVQSVVVKSANRQGAIFTFTRLTEADGSVSYLGRMLDRTAGDALEITKEGAGYVIRKKGFHDIINE